MCNSKQAREKYCFAFDGIDDFVDPYSREFNYTTLYLSINSNPYFGLKLNY